MKLSSLNPAIIEGDAGRFLILDCPHCLTHRIAVAVVGEAKMIWAKSDFDKLTLESVAPLESCKRTFKVSRGVVAVG